MKPIYEFYPSLLVDLDPGAFRKNLEQAIAWCKDRVDLADVGNCLRSEALCPFDSDEVWWPITAEFLRYMPNKIDHRPANPHSFLKGGYNFITLSSDADRRTIFDLLVSKRAQELSREGVQPYPVDRALGGGRFLLVDCDSSTAMGEHTPQTEFISYDDTPAWDSWVYYSDPLLISWVPEQLITQVQNAVNVSALENVLWLDQPTIDQIFSRTEIK